MRVVAFTLGGACCPLTPPPSSREILSAHGVTGGAETMLPLAGGKGAQRVDGRRRWAASGRWQGQPQTASFLPPQRAQRGKHSGWKAGGQQRRRDGRHGAPAHSSSERCRTGSRLPAVVRIASDQLGKAAVTVSSRCAGLMGAALPPLRVERKGLLDFLSRSPTVAYLSRQQLTSRPSHQAGQRIKCKRITACPCCRGTPSARAGRRVHPGIDC